MKINYVESRMKYDDLNPLHAIKIILVFLAIGLLPIAARADVTSSPSVLQFRLVADVRTAQTEEMTVVQPGQPPNQPEVLNVQKEALLDRSDVKSAKFGAQISGIPDNGRGPMEISINFTDDGTKRLAEVTGKHVGERLAIVIDGKLYSAPRINTPITGGKAEITGNFTKEEARDLATKINGAPVYEALTWSRIGFYCFAVLFTAATGIVVWMALRRNDASSAVPPR